ncbi:DUF3298 and DUF4163 domain-containing protein [Anaerosinus sp.]|uniref:DUF3298 and DUF4163 domain-containing protein n=1 Tax=Selenobaculum sp. TaxID=3074374 RepID=UPI0015B30CA1
MKKSIAQISIIFTIFTLCLTIVPQTSFAAEVRNEQYATGVYSLAFPQLVNNDNLQVQDKINHDIQLFLMKFMQPDGKVKPEEAKLTYEVHYLSNDLFSIEFTAYTFWGGAHGQTISTSFNYDLKTGEELKLTQMFDYKPSEINKAIFAHCEKNSIPLYNDFKGITQYPSNFYLTSPTTPVLVFQQYDIAPYSSGIIKVELK